MGNLVTGGSVINGPSPYSFFFLIIDHICQQLKIYYFDASYSPTFLPLQLFQFFNNLLYIT